MLKGKPWTAGEVNQLSLEVVVHRGYRTTTSLVLEVEDEEVKVD